jgi:hypothetical protein
MSVMKVLENYAWDQQPNLPGFSGRSCLSGRRGPVVFVATEDHDGQIEISLAKFDPKKRPGKASKPCSAENAFAFFKAIGVIPIEGFETKTTRHFVVRRGSIQ